MIYVWIALICIVLMIVFIIPTLLGGKWHDKQKAMRERAEQARSQRLKQESTSNDGHQSEATQLASPRRDKDR